MPNEPNDTIYADKGVFIQKRAKKDTRATNRCDADPWSQPNSAANQ